MTLPLWAILALASLCTCLGFAVGAWCKRGKIEDLETERQHHFDMWMAEVRQNRLLRIRIEAQATMLSNAYKRIKD